MSTPASTARSDAAERQTRKYGYKSKQVRATHVRVAWRERAKRVLNPKTRAELKAASTRRRAKEEDIVEAVREGHVKIRQTARELFERFGTHDVDWWYMRLIQASHKQSSRRRPSKWNAYQALTKKKRKAEGLPRLKAPELSKLISNKWQEMSEDERNELTTETLEELEDRREMKTISMHQVPAAAFKDVVTVQKSITTQITELCERTKTEAIVILVRSEVEHFNKPWTFSTSEGVSRYFQMTCKSELEAFATQMESYCLSGVAGAANTYEEQLNALKSETSALIRQKLESTARSQKVRMFYKDFRSHVTRKYGVILEGWPLKSFTPPGSINSRPDLLVLYGAWKSGTAQFRSLTQEEWTEWEDSGKPVVAGINGVPLGEDADRAHACMTPGDGPSTSATTAATGSAQPPPNTSQSGEPTSQPNGAAARNTSSPPPGAPERIPSPPTEAPESTTFVMSFQGDASTAAIVPPPKKRKTRSDKGKPRGPNTRTTQAAKKRRVEDPAT